MLSTFREMLHKWIIDVYLQTPHRGIKDTPAHRWHSEVRQFAERYVATSVLAKQVHLNIGSLSRYLKDSRISLLAIPKPARGRGHAFSLPKDVAAQIQVPSQGMLSEQAQRRIKADRKKRWAEYRLAKEAASRKPMRRQLRRIAVHS